MTSAAIADFLPNLIRNNSGSDRWQNTQQVLVDGISVPASESQGVAMKKVTIQQFTIKVHGS
jgi:hypothetical protein